jgi:DNA-binding LacI/PurR family transcriptional regulator
MREVGVEPQPGWEVDGNFDLAGGRASGMRLLRRNPEVTAVFASSDEMAMGVILAARELGLRVPEDLSVIGVDGHPHGALVGLTSITQDAFAQGHAAALGLLQMVVGETSPRSVTYATRLVERGSVASPRLRGGA